MNILLISYHLISYWEQVTSGSDGNNFDVAWVEYRRIVGYSDRGFSSFLSVSKLYLDKSRTASFCLLSTSLFAFIKVTGRHIVLKILAAC
jgi:hypothetical protein